MCLQWLILLCAKVGWFTGDNLTVNDKAVFHVGRALAKSGTYVSGNTYIARTNWKPKERRGW